MWCCFFNFHYLENRYYSYPKVLSTLPEEERLEFYEKFSYITKHISDCDFFKLSYGNGLSFQEAVEKNLEIFKTREYTL